MAGPTGLDPKAVQVANKAFWAAHKDDKDFWKTHPDGMLAKSSADRALQGEWMSLYKKEVGKTGGGACVVGSSAACAAGPVQNGLSQADFCNECKNCKKTADGSIAWAKRMQKEYTKAGNDPANRTLEDVNDAVEKSLAAQGILTETAGTTDESGTITVKKQKGPCARLEEKGTELHEQVHQNHTRDLEKKYGKGTPEFSRHWNDAKDDAHDEVNAYQSEIDFWTQFKKECQICCP